MKRLIYAISALALVGALWVAGVSASASDTALGVVPADLVLRPLSEGPATISRTTALDVARSVAPMQPTTKLSASLVVLTDPNTLRGDIAIKDRAVWLIHLSGAAEPISIPYGAKPPPITVLSNGYIYVDAYTGEWLLSRYEP